MAHFSQGQADASGTPPPFGPLVSIVIPYYNQPDFVLAAVLSAKEQTYTRIEVIVVDDGSLVPAEPLLAGVDGITVLRTENRGVSAARNLGFANSTGDMLIFLDGDDVLLPNAVETQIHALGAQPGAGLSFGSCIFIDADNHEIGKGRLCRPRPDYFITLLECNPIACPGAAMIRRTAFVAAGRFDEQFRLCEDYQLYLRIARYQPLVRHEECVVKYRKHENNISRDQAKMFVTTMAVLDEMVPLLTKSERRRLPHARRRWAHQMHRKSSLVYRVRTLYFAMRAMANVPFTAWFLRTK